MRFHIREEESILVSILRYTFGSLLIVLLVAIVLVLTLDFGRFKTDAEVFVSNLLQREFAIGGPLHLTIGRSIELSATDVSLASTPWSTAQTLVSFRHIEASINTWSLIRGPIRLQSLTLDGLRLNLEEKESGENNWTLIESSQEDPISADTPATEDMGEIPSLPVLPENIDITDVVLSYHNPKLARPILAVIDRVNEVILESNQTQFTLNGDINEIPVNLTLAAGTVSHLVEYSDVKFDLDAAVGDIRIKADIAIADLLNPSRPTATVSLSGPKIEHLTEVLGIQQITTGPLQLDLEVKPDKDIMRLDLTGTLGEFAVHADGQFADLQKLQNIELQVSASGPDIGRIAGLAGIEGVPNDPFNLAGTLRRSGTIISGEDITFSIRKTIFSLDGRFEDFPNPGSVTASLHVEGPDVGLFSRLSGLPGRFEGPFEVEAKIAPKGEEGASISLKADAGDISIKVDGDLTDDPDFVGAKAQIRLQAASFRRIADAFEIEYIPERTINLKAVAERVDAGISIKDGLLVFGKDQLAFNGLVGDEPLKPVTDIRFQSKIPDIKATLADFEIEMEQLPSGELLAAGQIVGGDERIAVKDLKVSLAGMKAKLDAKLKLASILSDSEISFLIEGDDLSGLVPSSDVFRAPEKEFSLDGSVLLKANTATIPKLQFHLGNNQLTADILLGLDPALKSVHASIAASGPNLSELTPYFDKIAVGKPVPFELRSEIVWEDGLLEINDFLGKVSEARLEIDGRIEDPPDFNNTDLRLVLHIADMHNLSVFAGRELPHEPADLTIHLLGKDNTVTAKEFNGSLGDSDLSGDLFFRAGDIPELNLKLASRRLNLTPYLPPVEQVDQRSVPNNVADSKAASENRADSNVAPESGSATSQNLNHRVIPDTPIPFDLLEGFTAKVDLRIKELNLRQRTARDLAVSAAIDDGSLEIQKFKMKTKHGGELSGRLDVKPKNSGTEIWMTLAGKKLELGLPAETKEEYEALPRYDINLAFLASGDNPRELAGALSGYFKLNSGAGKLKAGSMQMFTSDFLFQLLNTINPFAKSDPHTNLKCTVMFATVEQGTLIGKPALVLQTDRLNIFAQTNIDLSTESLDVTFNTVPQKGLGLSLSNLVNPYVKVVGSLGSPILALNPEGAILEGGAAVATGGLSIFVLGLKDRFMSDKKPCDTALAETDEQFAVLVERYRNPPSSED
jgi:uncharacterized protein involved in outer membrane biogenesis